MFNWLIFHFLFRFVYGKFDEIFYTLWDFRREKFNWNRMNIITDFFRKWLKKNTKKSHICMWFEPATILIINFNWSFLNPSLSMPNKISIKIHQNNKKKKHLNKQNKFSRSFIKKSIEIEKRRRTWQNIPLTCFYWFLILTD